LVNRARETLVKLAKRLGVPLRQSYTRVGKIALIKHQRYAHARQFGRARKALRKLKTYLGRVIRDIIRKIAGDDWLQSKFAWVQSLHLKAEAPPHSADRTREAATLRRRAGIRSVAMGIRQIFTHNGWNRI
jgi:IS5 family transposase